MAMARPIITDAIPGVIDYLDEDSAFLARNKNYEEEFKRAMEDEKDREQRGLRARKKAEREFEWGIIAKKTSEVYKNIVNNTYKYHKRP